MSWPRATRRASTSAPARHRWSTAAGLRSGSRGARPDKCALPRHALNLRPSDGPPLPIVIFSIKWWRTQHPAPVFWGGGSMPHDWAAVFGWQVLAVMLIGAIFTAVRLRQEQFQREIDSLRRMAHAL